MNVNNSVPWYMCGGQRTTSSVWSHFLTCFETTSISLFTDVYSKPTSIWALGIFLSASHLTGVLGSQRCTTMPALYGFWGLELRFSLTLAWQMLYPWVLPSPCRKTFWESIKIVSTCLMWCSIPVIPAWGVARVETSQVRGSLEGWRGKGTSQLGMLTSLRGSVGMSSHHSGRGPWAQCWAT